MNNTLNFNNHSKASALLQDQANHADHMLKTIQHSLEKLSDGATTSIGTLRRYTKQKTSSLFGFLGRTSDLAILWAANEASNLSQVAADLLADSLKLVSNFSANSRDDLSKSTLSYDVALSGSLADCFQLSNDPEFVNDLVANAIVAHRDVALRDITAMANDTFIGPYRPATADLIKSFQLSGQSDLDFQKFQDAILERRGLALTDGLDNPFGVAVCPTHLNKLTNSFGNTGAATSHPVWTFAPIQEVTSARALDTQPTLKLRPNFA